MRKLVKDVGRKINRIDETPPEQNTEETQLHTITLPWIPGVSPKKVFRKAGYKVAFKANPNLQTILTKKNKVELPPNSYPGVYRIPCGCNKVPPYTGQTKLETLTRLDQHNGYVEKAQWTKSRTCPVGLLFDQADTLKPVYRKFDRSVREVLEIQRHRSAPWYGGINLDDGQYVKTTFWIPLMDEIRKEEKGRKDKRNRRITSTPPEIHPPSNQTDVHLTSNYTEAHVTSNQTEDNA